MHKKKRNCVLILLATLMFFIAYKVLDRPLDEPVAAVHSVNAAPDAKQESFKSAQDSPAEETEFTLPEQVKEQLLNIVDSYEFTSGFPLSSQPVLNSEQVYTPEPFEFNATESFDLEEGGIADLKISLATEKYKYVSGEKIVARLQLFGEILSTARVGIEATTVGSTASARTPLYFTLTNPQEHIYQAELDSITLLPEKLTSEMSILATVTIDDRTLFATANFRYNSPDKSATILNTLDARVDGPTLVIPLEVSVSEGGLYTLQAVLNDASTQQPLVVLENSGRLSTNDRVIELRAHVTALKFKESEGPYSLSFQFFKRMAKGDEVADVDAVISRSKYPVNGFPFEDYEDEEYRAPGTDDRLAFIEALAAGEVIGEVAADNSELKTEDEAE